MHLVLSLLGKLEYYSSENISIMSGAMQLTTGRAEVKFWSDIVGHSLQQWPPSTPS